MHLGRPHVIGCWEVDGALVDPGPESSLGTVLEAIGGEQPRAVLLTHIHLDHAAATGALVRRWPELEVYVHERGAPHLIDPSKLLASAERLYGDRLNYLWGEILPVPEQNVCVLSGGERVHGMRVAYTPGHASHHVCYFHEESGTAFTGDVAACRIPPSHLPQATPPPTFVISMGSPAPPSPGMSPPVPSRPPLSSCPPLPRPTSTSRSGGNRLTPSLPGSRSASPSPTSGRSTKTSPDT